MIRNYIKTAWRSLYKSKLFSLINIFGLSISMSVCLLVIMIVSEQYRSDQHNPLKDRIYRVNSNYQLLDRGNSMASSPLPLAESLGTELSSIDGIATICEGAGGDANTGSKVIPVGGFYVSNEIFDILDFHLQMGDESSALAQPYSMVLSEAAAIKLYGHTNVVSSTISLKDQGDYTITGVLENSKNKSHVDGFEIFVSISTLPSLEEKELQRPIVDNWDAYYQSYVYVLLNENSRVQDVEAYMNELAKEKYADRENFAMNFSLQNLVEITPYTKELSNQIFFTMPLVVLIVLSGLALMIMLSAAFNYTNLTIARALSRAKEIGIRKVSGANRGQIFAQFMTESIVVSLIALGIAWGLLYFLIPAFYDLDPHIKEAFSVSTGPNIGLLFVVFSILVGVIGGLFPALYLSKFNPTVVLKSLSGIKLFARVNARKVLIVSQFTLSMLFIITAFIMNNQFKYALNYDLGFNKDQVLNVDLGDLSYETVATEFERVPGVQEISGSRYVMGIGRLWAEYMRHPDQTDSMTVAFLNVTPNYLQNLEHDLVTGSHFPADHSGETEEFIIINEKAVKELQYESPQAAVGQRVITETGEPMIVGVAKDFHFERLENPINAFAFKLVADYDVANIRIAGDPTVVLMNLEKAWKKIDDVHAFSHHFYDEQIEEAYVQYMILTKMVGFFAFLAISIACVGLLGMAVYTSELRTREVGIRKVLGAEVGRIVFLLSKGFIWLLLVATIIAVPAAWFINDLFLSDVAVRAPIGVFLLLKGSLIMLVLGLIIICSQTIRVALANPAQTLKNE